MDNCCNGQIQNFDKNNSKCCKSKESLVDVQQTYYDLGFNSGRKTIKDEIKKIVDSGMTDSAIVSWLKGLIS
jgi:hypothetical protein